MVVLWFILLFIVIPESNARVSVNRPKQEADAIGRNPLDGKDVLVEDEECFTRGPVRNSGKMRCKIVNGPLTFNSDSVTVDNPWKLDEIRGCVTIENTEFKHVDWLKDASTICASSNRIAGNRILCMEQTDQEQFIKKNYKLEVYYDKCPTCEIMGPKCRTLVADFVYSESNKILPHIINGRLYINNTKFPDHKLNVTVVMKMGKGPDPAVIIYNTTIPDEENLVEINIDIYGTQAMRMEYIQGYKFPRQYLLKMQKKAKGKNFDIDVEAPGDCYIPYRYDIMTSVSSLLDCEHIIGLFKVETEDYSPLANWQMITSIQNMYIYEKEGSDLGKILSNLRKIKLYAEVFEIRFDNKICYKSDVMARLQSVFDEEEKHKPRHVAENCTKYLGYVNAYDLKYDNGSLMEEIKGAFILEPMHLLYEKQCDPSYDDGKPWQCDANRFKNLKTIKKPTHMQDDLPALVVEVCGSKVKVPDWVFTVTISSFRNDDVLIKINGPGYKMEAEKYKILEEKYGRKRLDIDPMTEGECFFNDTITDMKQLDGCERIVGNLKIIGPVKNKPNTIIRQIVGCVYIVDTNLENLDFIQFEIPYSLDACLACYDEEAFAIKNNTNLCANHWMFGVREDQVSGNKKGCGNTIDKSAYQETNFAFYSDFNNSEYSYLKGIKQIVGRIIFASTKEKEIDVFSNVESIVYMGPGPAILLENNLNLKKINFSSLKGITVRKGGVAIQMLNNPKLELSTKENEDFKKATHGKIEIHNPPPEEEEEHPFWKAVGTAYGIGLAIIVGVCLVIAAIVISAVKIRAWRSKSSKANKKNDKTENGTAKEVGKEKKKKGFGGLFGKK